MGEPQRLLWAAGLRDLTSVPPGEGYTGHAFNDANHCDATTMLGEVSHNLNEAGKDRVAAIAVGNRLGPGIEVASLPELGEGGSWSTCTNGCHMDPPRDVAHVQFRSRIAFKLVWCPPTFETFVLVDDDGDLLATGCPTGPGLPDARQRVANYGRCAAPYAVAADKRGVVRCVGCARVDEFLCAWLTSQEHFNNYDRHHLTQYSIHTV